MTSDPTRDTRWERVHIFISSTFNDMHAERDYLVKRVFPQLADWCERRRLRMVDVDLRWGVTEQDATRNRGVVQVCLRRIDESRPFFLCLLGQRYGWVPRDGDVSSGTLNEFPGLSDELAAGRSVTELEILHAIVRPFAGSEHRPRSEQAVFYLRHPSALRKVPRDPRQLWRTYTDAAESDPERRRFLLSRRRHLRKVTLPATGRPVAVYTAAWNAAARTPELEMPLQCPAVMDENVERWRRQWGDAGVRVDGLDVDGVPGEAEKAHAFNARLSAGRLADFAVGAEPFAERVLRDLKAAIEARFPGRAPIESDDPLDRELTQQEQFQSAAAEGFVERSGDFAALDRYITDAGDRPFVLTAPAGTGKSMLLARWIARVSARMRDQGSLLLYRFIGASDRSTSVTDVLELLVRQLRHSGIQSGATAAASGDALRQIWPEMLTAAGAARPTVIVIDALDQLQSGLGDLTWIPRKLPPGVKVIVSVRHDAVGASRAIESFQLAGAEIAAVRPFESTDDRRRLVGAYLAQFLKELDERHLEALIAAPGAENPLYLKVVLSELRVFGAFMNLGAKIRQDFGATPQSAFEGVLRRLEADPAYAAIDPAAAVPLIFGLLAASRRGLSAQELASIVSTALGRDTSAPQESLDTVHLILRQVRSFLARRDGRHDFFYDAFRRAAFARYTGGDGAAARPEGAWHALLAGYFHALPTWQKDPAGARTPNARKTAELPFHLTLAGDGARLGKILGDLEFLEAKCAANQTFELVDDYVRIPAPLRTEAIDQFGAFIRANAHVLAEWPGLTFQQAANTVATGTMTVQSAPAKAAVFRQVMGLESRPWVRRLNPVPNASAFLTLAGHEGTVLALALTSGSDRVVSAGVDGTLRVWDLRTGAAMETVRNAIEGLPGLVGIPASSRIAYWGKGRRIVIWDYELLQPVAEFDPPEHGVSCMAVDPSGRFLFAGTSTMPGDAKRGPVASAVLYDLQSGTPCDVGFITRRVSAAALSAGAATIYSADGNTISAFDRSARRVIAERRTAGEDTGVIRLAPDGRSLVIGEWGDAVEVWSPALEPLATLAGSRQAVIHDVAFSPDGRELAAAGIDGTIAIWDLAARESRTRLRGHTGPVNTVAYTHDGSRLVSAGGDGTLRVWDPQFDRDFFAAARRQMADRFDTARDRAEPERAARQMEGLVYLMSSIRKHFNAVLSVAAASSGRRGVSISLDDTVRLWDMEAGTCARILEGHEGGIWSVAVSADGQRLATSDRNGKVIVWDVDRGEQIAERVMLDRPAESAEGPWFARLAAEMYKPVVAPLKFLWRGSVLATADSLSTAIKLWNAESLELRATLAGHTGRVGSLVSDREGLLLVSSADDGLVIAWEPRDGTERARLAVPVRANVSGQAPRISVTADGRVACAWPDGSIRLFESSTLSPLGELRRASGPVASLTSAGDVLFVAREAAEGGVEVEAWHANETAPFFIERCPAGMSLLDVEDAGRRFAVGGRDGLLIRDLEKKRALRRYPFEVNCAAFAGQRVIAAGGVGDVYLLDLV